MTKHTVYMCICWFCYIRLTTQFYVLNFETLIHGFTYTFSYNFTYVARNHLEAVFRDRWFGRGVAWPLQPHDLVPFDLFHGRHPTSLICDTPMKTEEDLVVSILVACETIQTSPGYWTEGPQFGTVHRCSTCCEVIGSHFEELLWIIESNSTKILHRV